MNEEKKIFIDKIIDFFKIFKICNSLIKLYYKYRKIWLYLFFGAVSTIINIVTYQVFANILKLNFMFSNVIAWIFAVICAYLTNKYFVFESKTTTRKESIREINSFFVARILSLLLDMIIMYLGVKVFIINDLLVKIVSNIIVVIVNYFLSKFIIFNKKDEKKINREAEKNNMEEKNKQLIHKEKIKMNKKIIIFVMIYIIISLIIYINKFYNNYTDYHIIDTSNVNDSSMLENLDENNKNISIKTTFRIDRNNFSGVSFYLEPREADGAEIILEDAKSQKIIKTAKIEDTFLYSSDKYILKFDKIKDSINKEYNLYINYNNFNKNSFLPKVVSKEKTNANYDIKTFVQNKEISENLSMSFLFKKIYALPFLILTYVIILLVYYGVVKSLINKLDLTIEGMFLITIPLLSLIYFFVIPISDNPDEILHYKRVLEICNGKLVTECHKEMYNNNVEPKGAYLDESYNLIEQNNINAKYVDVVRSLKIKENGNIVYVSPFGASQYSFVSYIFYIIGTYPILKIVHLPMLALYAGKFTNLICLLILGYYTLKLLPRYKDIFFIFMMTPTYLTLISAISADGIVIAMTFFVMAYIFNIIDSKEHKIGYKEITLLAISMFIISLCKTGWVAIVITLFMIPKDKFKIKNGRVLIISIFIISLMLAGMWYITTNRMLRLDHLPTMYNVKAIKNNPFNFLFVAINTIIRSSLRYSIQTFGYLIFNFQVDLITMIPIFIAMLVAMLKNNYKTNLREKIFLGMYSLAIIAFVLLTFYLINSPSNVNTLLGIQGRYFITALPILLIFISEFVNKYIKVDLKFNTIKFYGIIVILANLPVILNLLIWHI